MKYILLSLLFCLGSSACAAVPRQQPAPTVQLHGHRFNVELATNDGAREHGLMMRKSMDADHGMLFVFAAAAPQAFWMKNTLIALDILYFDANRKLVSLQLDVPPCKADPCPTYPSDVPARYVLELNAGTAVRIGAQAGDILTVDGAIGAVH